MSMLLTLRVIHIITGIFWAGTMFFVVSFLMPAFKDVGPDGAKVSAALANRRMHVWLPLMAIASIVSGFWLYGLRMGGGGGWAAGMEARMLGIGGLTALIAFIIGVTVTRPAMMKADVLSAELAAASGAERDAKVAAIGGLRKRALMGSRAIATLLLITVVTMAIAQYAI